MGEHGQLGAAGRARGGADHGHVVAAAGGDLLVEPARVGLGPLPAGGLDGGELEEVGHLVELEAAGVVVDDLLDTREPVLQLDDLVDLFLVLGHHQPDLPVGEDVDDLLPHAGRVDPHGAGAERLGGQLGDQPLRPVVAEDGHHLAGADAEGGEAVGEVAHPGVELAPGGGLPDPVALLLDGDPAVAVAPVELGQQLGEGGGLVDGERLRVSGLPDSQPHAWASWPR